MIERLERILNKVKDEESFIDFLNELVVNREQAVRKKPLNQGIVDGWENNSIEDYLESVSAWAEDSKDQDGLPIGNPWKRVADMLYAGKYYE